MTIARAIPLKKIKHICEEVILTNHRQVVVHKLCDTDRLGSGRSSDFG